MQTAPLPLIRVEADHSRGRAPALGALGVRLLGGNPRAEQVIGKVRARPPLRTSSFSLSRRMGTSLDMIDRTYGHLAPDAEAVELALLNAYDAQKEAFGHGVGTERIPHA